MKWYHGIMPRLLKNKRKSLFLEDEAFLRDKAEPGIHKAAYKLAYISSFMSIWRATRTWKCEAFSGLLYDTRRRRNKKGAYYEQ